MTRVLVDDPDLARHLAAARTKVEICDGSGLVLGYFVPQVLAQDKANSPEAHGLPKRGDGADDDFWKSVGIE
jgi:hypothetical protein